MSGLPVAIVPRDALNPRALQPHERARPPALRSLATVLLLLGAAVLGGCATTPLPTDPFSPTCPTMQAPEFAGWFEPSSVSGGTVKLNGIAKPADSLNFPDAPNCSFYKWSEQMFLWLTSPAPATYGGNGLIFQSPVFYDVSPLDANWDRTLIPHTAGLFTNLTLRAAQVGKQGLQVVEDNLGRTLELEPPRFGPSGKQLILNKAGEPVEIGRATFGVNRQPVFLDTAGKTIENPRAVIRPELDQEHTIQKFVVQQTPVFLDSSGNVIQVENGQADGSILMAQTGSLVYYSITVNDVYAYFLTGVKNGGLPPTSKFPTTAAEISAITQYASQHGTSIPDPEAMAVEVKMSWVEAASLPHPNDYITAMATIPVYSQSPNYWTATGQQKTVKMALVGVHVVGFTAGPQTSGHSSHGEGVWATFEHQGNTPALTYSYLSTSGVQTVNPSFATAWLFCQANPPASAVFNEPHMKQDPLHPENIMALGSFPISPSNTMRVEAWGGAANASPNPVVVPSIPLATAASARSNSELISINNSVRGLLNSADLRKKYILTGSTWTIGGASPTTSFGNPGNSGIVVGRAVGTSEMANSTMESYQQLPFSLPHTSSFSPSANNCFSCHSTNTTSVSHIFSTPGHPPHGTKPLFP